MPDKTDPDFTEKCRRHPGGRFQQASGNWSEAPRIVTVLDEGRRSIGPHVTAAHRNG